MYINTSRWTCWELGKAHEFAAKKGWWAAHMGWPDVAARRRNINGSIYDVCVYVHGCAWIFNHVNYWQIVSHLFGSSCPGLYGYTYTFKVLEKLICTLMVLKLYNGKLQGGAMLIINFFINNLFIYWTWLKFYYKYFTWP